MQKNSWLWEISDLRARISQIDFPEYQREPTIWTRVAKQLLVDSIMREFDISAIYLYRLDKDQWDCIDGRQRISAILSFMGDNRDDRSDNKFNYRVMNEIFRDEDHPYQRFHEHSYADICKLAEGGDEKAKSFRKNFESYEVTIVELSESALPAEFNLQFTRLNLGQLIISGEKLNAMVGDLRDLCFGELGNHSFLSGINIPTRRYARQQLAAQIVSQVFAYETSKRDGEQREFARMRHGDLQRLFKLHASLEADEARWIDRVSHVMDLLAEQLNILPTLRSRSIVLSLVLLAYELGIDNHDDATELAMFANEFLDRLKGQISLGLDAQDEYRYLNDFQRYLTQASVEKYSVAARAKELDESFNFWRKEGQLKGDRENQEGHRDQES